jgi:hypothetical protein
VADQIDIGRRIALGVGQRVGIERAADLGSGLARDLLHQPGVGHVLQKDRRDLLLLDLRDDGGHVPGRCLRFRRHALRRGERDAIGVLEISERVVAGDDPAAVGGNPGDHVPHLALERIELGEIGGGVRGVGVLAGGIGGDQRVANIGNIDLGVGHRLPGVRIRRSMVVIMTAVARALARLDAFGRDDDRRLGAGRFHQPLEPALETEAVHEHQFGVGSALGVARRGRVDMGIAVGTDQRADLHALAADVLHEVAQDREAGDDVELVLRAGGGRRQERRAGNHDHRPASGQHGFLLCARPASGFKMAAREGLPHQAADAPEQQREHVKRAGDENDRGAGSDTGVEGHQQPGVARRRAARRRD